MSGYAPQSRSKISAVKRHKTPLGDKLQAGPLWTWLEKAGV